MDGRGDESVRWRGKLRRDIAVLFALKVAALALLWALFFSSTARLAIDGAAAGRQLGLTHRELPSPPAGLSHSAWPLATGTMPAPSADYP